MRDFPTVALIDNGVIGQYVPSAALLSEEAAAGVPPRPQPPYTGAMLHGTLCARAILDVAPNTRLQSLRIATSGGTARAADLIWAIGRAVEGGADIVNVSMGVSEDVACASVSAPAPEGGGACVDLPDWPWGLAWLDRLAESIGVATSRGVVVVAATHPLGIRTYPAAFPSVVAVDAAFVDHAGQYALSDREDSSDFLACGMQVLGTGPGEVVTASGSSFAAACVSGHLAEILLQRPGMSARDAVGELARRAMPRGQRQVGGLLAELRSSTPPRVSFDKWPCSGSVALFPFDRDMQRLMGASDLLDGRIVAVADLPGSPRAGWDAGGIVAGEPTGVSIASRLTDLPPGVGTLVVGDIWQPALMGQRDILCHVLAAAEERGWHTVLLKPPPWSVPLAGRVGGAMAAGGLSVAANPRIETDLGKAVWSEDPTVLPVCAVMPLAHGRHGFEAEVALLRGLRRAAYNVAHVTTHWQFGAMDGHAVVHVGLPPLGPDQPPDGQLRYLRALKVGLVEHSRADVLVAGMLEPLFVRAEGGEHWSVNHTGLAIVNALRADAVFLVGCASDTFLDVTQYRTLLEGLSSAKVVALLVAGSIVAAAPDDPAAPVAYVRSAPESLDAYVAAAASALGLPVIPLGAPDYEARLVALVEGAYGS